MFPLPEERLFAFAALWEEWKCPDGEVVQSCTVLTTAADGGQSLGARALWGGGVMQVS